MTNPTERADEVIAFWFDTVGKARWFAKDAALDNDIRQRFGPLRKAVLDSGAAQWRGDVRRLTAAVILLDQFGRNIFRGDAAAFGGDALALSLAQEALDKGWTHAAPPAWRAFLLMPLMHSEDLAVQDQSVAQFERLGEPETLAFALRHREQIARFGRFPGRNAALGRPSTAEEVAALAAGAAF